MRPGRDHAHAAAAHALALAGLLLACGEGGSRVASTTSSPDEPARSSTRRADASSKAASSPSVRRGELLELGTTGGELTALGCTGDEVAWATTAGDVSTKPIGAGPASRLGRAPDTVMALAKVAGDWYAATSGVLPDLRGELVMLRSGSASPVAGEFRFPTAMVARGEALHIVGRGSDNESALLSFDSRTRSLATRMIQLHDPAFAIAAGPTGFVIPSPLGSKLLPYAGGPGEPLPAAASAAWAGGKLAMLRQTADENVCELVAREGEQERVLSPIAAHILTLAPIASVSDSVCVAFSGTDERRHEDGSISCVAITGGPLRAVAPAQRGARKLLSCGEYLVWLRNGDELVALAPAPP